MTNQRNAIAVILIGSFALLVGGAGLYLGFKSDQTPYYHGPPVPKVPDHGPFTYGMRSIWSEPNRVRFEWEPVKGAKEYKVTVMSPEDLPLFDSPSLVNNAWVIPTDMRDRLQGNSVYHWKVTVLTQHGESKTSDPAAFATQ
jgi:hypothetical protein